MPTIRLAAAKGAELTPTEADADMKRTAVAQTSDYALDATHNREFHQLGGSVATVTLPTVSASFTETDDWFVDFRNNLTTNITFDRNSQNIDGAAADFVLPAGASVRIRMDAATAAFYTDLTWLVVQGTADSAATQTSSEYTGIPSWATEITISISAMSTNGTVSPKIQIGDSGVYESTGYAGSVLTLITAGITDDNVVANGFDIAPIWTALSVVHGSYTLTLLDSATNLWAINGGVGYSNTPGISQTIGSKALSGVLDRVRVIMDGTDVFDGSTMINISYRR